MTLLTDREEAILRWRSLPVAARRSREGTAQCAVQVYFATEPGGERFETINAWLQEVREEEFGLDA